jgi:hypothetical protein
VPQLLEPLKKQKADDILVVVVGVIPAQDYAFLEKAGVAAIFGPGTDIPEAAREVLKLIRARARAAVGRNWISYFHPTQSCTGNKVRSASASLSTAAHDVCGEALTAII